jgi:ArsR family transcriptional regulator
LKTLQALADENRLRILEALRRGKRCVCELQDDLGLGQSLLSHHLRVLRESGLVVDRRQGRWVYYSLSGDAVSDLEGYLREIREQSMIAEPGQAPAPPPDPSPPVRT